jgi:hypothetical protein
VFDAAAQHVHLIPGAGVVGKLGFEDPRVVMEGVRSLSVCVCDEQGVGRRYWLLLRGARWVQDGKLLQDASYVERYRPGSVSNCRCLLIFPRRYFSVSKEESAFAGAAEKLRMCTP